MTLRSSCLVLAPPLDHMPSAHPPSMPLGSEYYNTQKALRLMHFLRRGRKLTISRLERFILVGISIYFSLLIVYSICVCIAERRLKAKMEDGKTENMKDLVDRLTLGVTRILESRPGVTEVRYVEKEPAERHTIISWEQKNCCLLPEDLRNFYQMTDGFLMTWSIKFDGNNMQLGTMVINSISTLCRLGTTSVYSLPNSPTLDDLENDTDDEGKEEDLEKPQFNSKYRIFELDCCNGNGKVCLVYKSVQSGVVSSHAEIWFLDRALYWHFLSDTFTAYYRLMLVHLGLPQWQYALTKYGISPQAKQWFNMYKPVACSASLVAEDAITFTNKLDPSLVFKNRAKLQNPKKKACAQLPAPQKSQTSLVTSKNSSQIGSTTKKMIP